MPDFAPMARVERQSIYDDLVALSDDQWDAVTACDPWTVRTVVAHLTALGNQTAPNFAVGMVRGGFSFDKFVAWDLAKYDQGSYADRLAGFEKTLSRTRTSPGPKYVELGEYVCHGEDIRRAIGKQGSHPEAHVVALAEEYKGTGSPVRGKARVAGLRLQATDVDWATGDGPEVRGPGVDLILAMSGRGAALDACDGEGLETLRSRC